MLAASCRRHCCRKPPYDRCGTLVAAQEPSAPGIAPSAPAACACQLSTGAGDILNSPAPVSDDVTIAFAQNSDCPFNLTASEIVYLRDRASDHV
jgi:hypothetical protein